jgi:hypothetical protein
MRRLSYLRERRDLLVVGRLDVVDGHTAVGTTDKLVGHLGYLFVANALEKLRPREEPATYSHVASIRVLEVENGGPVVRLVLLESTSCAGGRRLEGDRRVHGEVKSAQRL